MWRSERIVERAISIATSCGSFGPCATTRHSGDGKFLSAHHDTQSRLFLNDALPAEVKGIRENVEVARSQACGCAFGRSVL